MASCSGNDYLNAIPSESQMLIRLNTTKLSGTKSPLILKSLLHVNNVDETGLDLSKDVFFFEDAQGNFGLCAKVSSDSKLEKTLKQAGLSLTKRRDYQFAALPSNWVIGFSDEAALMMGPVVPAAQDDMIDGPLSRFRRGRRHQVVAHVCHRRLYRRANGFSLADQGPA